MSSNADGRSGVNDEREAIITRGTDFIPCRHIDKKYG